MNDTTNPIVKSKTYSLWIADRYEANGSVVQTRTGVLVINRHKEGYTATWQGQSIPMQEALNLAAAADCDGTRTLTDESNVHGIGTAEGHLLHRELGQKGFGRGFGVAAEVLGRPVVHLRALTTEEAQTVRSYANGVWGLVG